jgi:hypothetical protein
LTLTGFRVKLSCFYLSRLLHDLVITMRPSLLPGIAVLVSALALMGVADFSSSPPTPDTDSDGMADAYEVFFGLDPDNSSDAELDSDDDRLSNLQEAFLLTDPFVPDTDRDAFDDAADACPISRAYIEWGAPQFTTGDHYDYAHPDWFLRAYKSGGAWLCQTLDESDGHGAWLATPTNPPQTFVSAWFVPACESNMSLTAVSDKESEPCGGESLSIDLDRTVLTNNLRYAVHYLVSGNSALYVDLLDTNGTVLIENLCGNLMTEGALVSSNAGAEAVVILEIPTATLPSAAVLQLRRGEDDGMDGAIIVFEGLVYIDEDGDGLDDEQERQIGTSDYCRDTDGDGISDYDEAFGNNGGEHPADPVPEPDEDDEDENKGVIYVDPSIGDDTHTGRAPVPALPKAGVKRNGPKKTVAKGMTAVNEDRAHTLVIKSGAYNENLDVRGKNVKVVIEGKVRL